MDAHEAGSRHRSPHFFLPTQGFWPGDHPILLTSQARRRDRRGGSGEHIVCQPSVAGGQERGWDEDLGPRGWRVTRNLLADWRGWAQGPRHVPPQDVGQGRPLATLTPLKPPPVLAKARTAAAGAAVGSAAVEATGGSVQGAVGRPSGPPCQVGHGPLRPPATPGPEVSPHSWPAQAALPQGAAAVPGVSWARTGQERWEEEPAQEAEPARDSRARPGVWAAPPASGRSHSFAPRSSRSRSGAYLPGCQGPPGAPGGGRSCAHAPNASWRWEHPALTVILRETQIV